jgi:hypothetical protein
VFTGRPHWLNASQETGRGQGGRMLTCGVGEPTMKSSISFSPRGRMQDEWIAASHAGKAFRSVCLLDCRIFLYRATQCFTVGW